MSDHTITIPADLWGNAIGATPVSLRNYAKALTGERIDPGSINCSHVAGRVLLERLADEIERQAPRAEGWYRIRHGDTGGPGSEWRLLYWNGSEWLFRERESMRCVIHEEAAEIEPVTIGRADS